MVVVARMSAPTDSHLEIAHVNQLDSTQEVQRNASRCVPFTDLSQAKNQEYFGDGMSQEILDALAKVEGLRVIARTLSFSFKGKSADASDVGKRLNVENVLEGSVRREGNRIGITSGPRKAAFLQATFRAQDNRLNQAVGNSAWSCSGRPCCRAPILARRRCGSGCLPTLGRR